MYKLLLKAKALTNNGLCRNHTFFVDNYFKTYNHKEIVDIKNILQREMKQNDFRCFVNVSVEGYKKNN